MVRCCTLTCANGGYGFTSLSWETTGLLSQRETERKIANVAGRKHSFLQDITISEICHYSVYLWKGRFGEESLQTKGEKWEIHQRDKEKWPLWQKEMMKMKRSKWEQTDLQDQGFSVPPATSGHTLDDHRVSQSDNESVHGPCTNFTKLVARLDIMKAFPLHFLFHPIYIAP